MGRFRSGNIIDQMTVTARVDELPALVSVHEPADPFGVRYFRRGSAEIVEARPGNLYHYTTYLGVHEVVVERGDCAYWFADDLESAHLQRGPGRITSRHLATVVRGYMPENKSTSMQQGTTLPYVNGCSTKQLFPPDRPGDPTLQLLYMPPHTTEQAHHIHSTARVVYILRGRGVSVVGTSDHTVRHELVPGMVCVLEPMCPHHFETSADALVCIPLHVFSSSGTGELDHPMFRGTHVVGR
jgi:mannose-6-phosphate isomerase-like protein (cupin superfamily)